jgi:ADP-heptose:LPS heptosyltransferase
MTGTSTEISRRKVAVFVNGGIGRVVCAIPALEELHKTTDLIIVCESGMEVFLGHPELQAIAFHPDTKGLFEREIRHRETLSPEPYRELGYMNQKHNLPQAFRQLLCGSAGPVEPKLNLHLSKAEEAAAQVVLQQARGYCQKDRVIVVNPFGRSSQNQHGLVVDPSSRSLEIDVYQRMVKALAKDNTVIYMGEHQFQQPDGVVAPTGLNIRQWMAVIEAADYFIGCDSAAQHFAYSFGVPGTVILGSTFKENITYPKHFQVLEREGVPKVYSPIRICMMGCEEADRINDKTMAFTPNEVDGLVSKIKKDIAKRANQPKGKAPSPDQMQALQQPQQSCCPTHG